MKALVVYDSAYGYTERVAQAIGQALGSPQNVEVVRVGTVRPEQLAGLTILIVGSPTQRLRPTEAIATFLKSIPKGGLDDVKVAAFDTRLALSEIEKIRTLALVVKIFGGYAAPSIAAKLQKKGGVLAVPPEGFCVQGGEGPLVEGELERATAWAGQIGNTR